MLIQEARLLKQKSIESLILSVEHFNNLSDKGRVAAVLILLDHSFEMLLKAAILKNGLKIRSAGESNTIGFDACVRLALSAFAVPLITEEQALTLQSINGLRDAAQHHLLELSEAQLYFHAQSGLTLFRDLLVSMFGENLSSSLPNRALPISTIAPVDPVVMFTDQVDEIRRLLAPGRRKGAEAEAKLRALSIVDRALQGDSTQPSYQELKKLGKQITEGKNLEDLFSGIAAVNFITAGSGVEISLRITKREGSPVILVPEGTPGATVVAVKRVDELGYYNLSHTDLALKVNLSSVKTTAAIDLIALKDDPDCSKEFAIGRMKHRRYSQKAIEKIQDLLHEKSEEEIWSEYKDRQRARSTN